MDQFGATMVCWSSNWHCLKRLEGKAMQLIPSSSLLVATLPVSRMRSFALAKRQVVDSLTMMLKLPPRLVLAVTKKCLRALSYACDYHHWR